jgi:Sulfotransferase family
MSRISHKYKFIFFAFPKTGSESIRKMLDPYSDIKAVNRKNITDDNPFYTHITPKETKDIFDEKGWDYDKYYKFVCVRNPFSRLLSLYNMTCKNNIKTPSFSDWLFKLEPHSKKRGNWMLNGELTLKDFISSENDEEILIDNVLKLENIDSEMKFMMNKLKLSNKNVPHINKGRYLKSKTKNKTQEKYNLYYNKKMINFVLKHFNWEIEKYNYSF